MSEKKKPEITAEVVLGPQLGSDLADIEKKRFDMRRLSKINQLDKVWISYFLLKKKKRGGRFATAFCLNYLNLAVSEDGWRTNKMIQFNAASKGVGGVGELVKRPGLLQRNVTNRDWKKKADEKGATIVE